MKPYMFHGRTPCGIIIELQSALVSESCRIHRPLWRISPYSLLRRRNHAGRFFLWCVAVMRKLILTNAAGSHWPSRPLQGDRGSFRSRLLWCVLWLLDMKLHRVSGTGQRWCEALSETEKVPEMASIRNVFCMASVAPPLSSNMDLLFCRCKGNLLHVQIVQTLILVCCSWLESRCAAMLQPKYQSCRRV